MCRYKIMKQKTSERPIIRRTCIFISIAITLKFIYLLVKLHTFGFILKESATVATDFHFGPDYVIP
jgi:hypothetical protein